MSNQGVVKFLRKNPEGRQIVLLPYLGGYANSFQELARHLPEDMEVLAINPPGHGPCLQKPLTRFDEMTSLYAGSLSPHLRPGYLLLGHSMGGLVSYEMLPHLPFPPGQIVLSGINPPHVVAATRKKVSHLSDRDVLIHLVSMGGIPRILLKERELLLYYLPAFRADYEALETARFGERVHEIEAHIVYGLDDPFVEHSGVQEWRNYFPDATFATVEGGHMFINERPADLADYIRKIASACCV